MTKKLIGKWTSPQWGEVNAWRTTYAYGGTAVTLTCLSEVFPAHEPLATLSMRLDDSADLPKDQFYAKTYSDNRSIAVEALASGLFEHVGQNPEGDPIWRIK